MPGAGVLLAGVLPTSLHLELAAPLTFLLLLLPLLTHRASYGAAVTGGLVAVAASGLPSGSVCSSGRARASRSAQSSQLVVAELPTLVVIGVGTYAMRAAFLVTARRQPSALLARLLPHIGPAVLAAITLPALIAPRGSISIADTVPALLAAAISAVAWRRTKSLPAAEWPSGGLRPGRSAPSDRRSLWNSVARTRLWRVRRSTRCSCGASVERQCGGATEMRRRS